MTSSIHLWLRSETKPNEHRSALTPNVAKQLIAAGFQITVEKCKQRVFADQEFSAVGCTLVEPGTWKSAPANAYIVGLKELPEHDTSALSHTHIFFAHCYKQQGGWKDVLGRFARGKGLILDLEFLNDEKGRRVAAFGYHAGFAGTAIGLEAWCQQILEKDKKLANIKPYPNETQLIDHIKAKLAKAIALNGGVSPKVLVIGALGRCGTGACDFARRVGIPESDIIKWDMAETKKGGPFFEILDAHVFVNCIYLSQPIPPFLTKEMLDKPDRKLSVVVDVSCDTSNPHNPIPIYTECSTFDKPTLPVASKSPVPLDMISIDHLPTLLPREASDSFSGAMLPSFLQLKDRANAPVWKNAEALFHKKVEEMNAS